MAENQTGAPTAGTPAAGTAAPAATGTAPAGTPPAGAPATGEPAGTPPAGEPAGTPAGTPPAGEPAASGDDWATRRAAIAGPDEKLAKRLARYSSERDVVDALIAAQNKIASGTLKEVLPENATPEQKAEWREQNGIPADPAGYEYKPPTGVDLSDVDKTMIGDFIKTAHDSDMTPAQVQKAIDWHYKNQQAEMEAVRADDALLKQAGEDELRRDWGSEFRLNVNLITGLLDAAPAGLKDQMFGARLADGTVLGDNPAAMRWLASIAREINPTATVVPGAGGNAGQAIATEMATLRGMMGDKSSAYWKGPQAAAHQARYRELVDVQLKLGK